MTGFQPGFQPGFEGVGSPVFAVPQFSGGSVPRRALRPVDLYFLQVMAELAERKRVEAEETDRAAELERVRLSAELAQKMRQQVIAQARIRSEEEWLLGLTA
jgi:hypothetical protein